MGLRPETCRTKPLFWTVEMNTLIAPTGKPRWYKVRNTDIRQDRKIYKTKRKIFV